jgi:hypothetical protein
MATSGDIQKAHTHKISDARCNILKLFFNFYST